MTAQRAVQFFCAAAGCWRIRRRAASSLPRSALRGERRGAALGLLFVSAVLRCARRGRGLAEARDLPAARDCGSSQRAASHSSGNGACRSARSMAAVLPAAWWSRQDPGHFFLGGLEGGGTFFAAAFSCSRLLLASPCFLFLALDFSDLSPMGFHLSPSGQVPKRRPELSGQRTTSGGRAHPEATVHGGGNRSVERSMRDVAMVRGPQPIRPTMMWDQHFWIEPRHD